MLFFFCFSCRKRSGCCSTPSTEAGRKSSSDRTEARRWPTSASRAFRPSCRGCEPGLCQKPSLRPQRHCRRRRRHRRCRRRCPRSISVLEVRSSLTVVRKKKSAVAKLNVLSWKCHLDVRNRLLSHRCDAADRVKIERWSSDSDFTC